MGRIRRWFRGTFRPDRIETDSINTNDLFIGGNQINPLRLDADIETTSGTEVSHSFNSRVDHFAIYIDSLSFDSDTSDILLRVDNDTSGYQTRLTDGSEPSISDGIKLSDEGLGVLSGWLWGLATGANAMGFTGDLVNFDFQETMDQGKYGNDGTVGSVQLLDSDGSNISGDGADIYIFTIADY